MGFVYGAGGKSSIAHMQECHAAQWLARRIARDLTIPGAGELPAAPPVSTPAARNRTYGQATMPADMKALDDVNLADQIIGYLDLASRSQFRQVAKCTFNAAERVLRLHMAKMEKLEPAQRTKVFNTLLASHQFHTLDTHALIALGEGRQEIEALRAAYGVRPASQQAMPFVHWCLDRAIAQRSVRLMHLALCLPETDVNAMYERSIVSSEAPLHTIVFRHGQTSNQAVVREITASLVAHPNIDVNCFNVQPGFKETPLIKGVKAANGAVIEELAKHPDLKWNLPEQFWKETVLHTAAGEHFGSGKLRMLLPYVGKLNINAQDISGDTPLHKAVIVSDAVDNARLLIEAGADQTIRNNEGRTAYEEAIRRKKDHLLPLFTPPAPVAPEPGSWQDVLGVARDERNYAVVHQAYKRRILATHPDKGGSAEAFRKVRSAWEQAKSLLEKN